jgi:putative ABC transport system ATP-binding protein
LLGGLLRPLTGKIEIENVDIASLSETELDRMRGRQIGFVFQRNHLISALTVKNNLLMAPFLAGEKQHEERVDLVLDELGLREKKNAMIFELSQGQAQRVAIARAIINKPSLILADEPTSALDDKNCDQVIELLNKVAMENNAALIVATHDHRLKSRLKNQIIL